MGRFWGAAALGLYGRAYQLITIPTQNINFALGEVTFSALSRLQDNPLRLRNYFLKVYSLSNAITLPTTVFCVWFANDIILGVLGPKWIDTVSIFRLLSPTVLVLGIINPLASMLQATGLQLRSLKIALVMAPLVVPAYIIGLPFGPNGVAAAYSIAMALWLVPCVLWSVHGTKISPADIIVATGKPFLSTIIATAVVLGAKFYIDQLQSSFVRLAFEGSVMFVVYFLTLLFIMGEKTLYLDLLRGLRSSS